MNRNVESHFSVNPVDIDIQRSRFDRSFGHQFSGNVGDIIPWYYDEVVPGDTFKVTTSKVIRFPAFLKPVMDNLYLDTYYFYVPFRLVWEHTREFYGENTQSAWYPTVEYTIPQITFNGIRTGYKCGSDVGTIADYLGVCPPFEFTSDTVPDAFKFSASALYIRAYNKIYEDWFRSEAIQDPVNLYFGDSTIAYNASSPLTGGKPYKACKYHDYFTSMLPSAQRGPAVSFNLADSASITIPSAKLNVVAENGVHTMNNAISLQGTTNGSGGTLQVITDPNGFEFTTHQVVAGTLPGLNGETPATDNLWKSNLIVNYPGAGSVDITGINALSVNELRMAFQLQKWYEKSALYGGRYCSFIKGQYGVTAPDASLQRSEYLGGNRVPISITQVENTAGESTPLGTLGAYSATCDVSEDFIKSFTEPGMIIGVSVVRYKHKYSQGVEPLYTRKAMTDFYFPVFANLGNMPCKNSAIFVSGDETLDNQVFGYQEAYADYRYKPDRVSSLMRPGVSGSLASWNFADYYEETPTLSPEWLEEDPVNVDRTLAVSHDVSDQFFADFYAQVEATRPMPLYSLPGLIDHH